MDLYNSFIIYLILFRLSIIFTGLVSIYFGYQLFVKGVFLSGVYRGEGSTNIDANIGGNSFNIKNATPGTIFALFGVILISVMVWKGSPELLKEDLQSFDKEKDEIISTKLTLRSDDEDSEKIKTMMQETIQGHMANGGALNFLYSKGNYKEALLSIANNLNGLAWEYKEEGKLDKALPMSKLAVSISPEDPNFLDTLAEIHFDREEYALAFKYMSEAILHDDSKKIKLEKFKTFLPDS